jgi:hypothetical protein
MQHLGYYPPPPPAPLAPALPQHCYKRLDEAEDNREEKEMRLQLFTLLIYSINVPTVIVRRLLIFVMSSAMQYTLCADKLIWKGKHFKIK